MFECGRFILWFLVVDSTIMIIYSIMIGYIKAYMKAWSINQSRSECSVGRWDGLGLFALRV